jgi:hypothetical protein
MPSFGDAFRRGRDEARAKRGLPPLPARTLPPDDLVCEVDGIAENSAQPSDFAAALRMRDDDLAEAKRLLGEVTDYAEMIEARLIKVIGKAEVMAKALRLPGVKIFLLQRFHPDKYPDADEKQHALLTDALKTINAAYEGAGELEVQSSD